MKTYFGAVALAAILALGAGIATHAQQAPLQIKGFKSNVKLEQPVSGPLTDLNGHYKLRVTETTISPGGSISAHMHAGPGIRYVKSGELTTVNAGKTTIHRAGDYFFESGGVVGSGSNAGKQPVVIINFEILPMAWTGGSAIPPK